MPLAIEDISQSRPAPTLSYQTPAKRPMTAHNVLESTGKHVYTPAVIAIVGAALLLPRFFESREFVVDPLGPCGTLVLVLVWNVCVMLAGLWIIALWTHDGFGSLPVVVLKLLAIAAGALGVGSVIMRLVPGFNGVWMGWSVCVAIYWSLFAWLFELNPQETAQCVMLTTALRWMSYVLFIVFGFWHWDFCC